MNFRLILAVDLLDGIVVHGKRGAREEYKPINLFSSIVRSSDLTSVIEEIKPQDVYIADLNRLMNTGDNREIIKGLRNRERELRMMLDYGLRGIDALKEAVEAEIADHFVLGTETSSMDLLETASKSEISSDISISVSVDLFNKEVLTSDERLKIEPLLLIKELNEYPLRDVIVLELDRVGTKRGLDFDFLARAVETSEHDILYGGGVRSCEDIDTLEKIGIKGALVATALHDGSIPTIAFRKAVNFEETLFRFKEGTLRFVTDRMLGKLSTWLRILGHDTIYAGDLSSEKGVEDEDNALIAFAEQENRIILTRDKNLASLANMKGVQCLYIKTDDVMEQLKELYHHNIAINREPLAVRCSECNARIRKVEEGEEDMLREKSYVPTSMIGTWDFWICEQCGRIYWEGSHWRVMKAQLKQLK